MKPEERKSKIKKQNYGHILINLPREKNQWQTICHIKIKISLKLLLLQDSTSKDIPQILSRNTFAYQLFVTNCKEAKLLYLNTVKSC